MGLRELSVTWSDLWGNSLVEQKPNVVLVLMAAAACNKWCSMLNSVTVKELQCSLHCALAKLLHSVL